MLNLNCNAISGVQITHHFVRKLVRGSSCGGGNLMCLLGCTSGALHRVVNRFPTHQVFPLMPASSPCPQIAKKLRGCVVFTSSAAAAMPSPFSVQYAATKSFVSAFGASLAPEVKPHGIDVLVFHPSPVASRWVGAGQWGSRGGSGERVKVADCTATKLETDSIAPRDGPVRALLSY